MPTPIGYSPRRPRLPTIVGFHVDARGPCGLIVLGEPTRCGHCHRMVAMLVNRGTTRCVECDEATTHSTPHPSDRHT